MGVLRVETRRFSGGEALLESAGVQAPCGCTSPAAALSAAPACYDKGPLRPHPKLGPYLRLAIPNYPTFLRIKLGCWGLPLRWGGRRCRPQPPPPPPCAACARETRGATRRARRAWILAASRRHPASRPLGSRRPARWRSVMQSPPRQSSERRQSMQGSVIEEPGR